MAVLQWRKFNFFDKDIVKDPQSGQTLDKFKGFRITCWASGRGNIICGDAEGMVFFTDHSWTLISFPAYQVRISHLFQLKQSNILVTIGEDDEGIAPMVKVWNFDKRDSMNLPVCVRMLRVAPGTKPVAVSCVAAHENLQAMAVGFCDGSVLLVRGDITRERHSKTRVIHSDKHPVTGLAFRHVSGQTVLFVATTDTITSYNLTHKDFRNVLDMHGCHVNCSTLSNHTQDFQFVVGKSDALYFYQPDGRGPCLAFEGDKTRVLWFRNYLVVASLDTKTMARQGGMCTLTIYDIQNKFTAYSSPLPEIVDIVAEWGSLFIISTDNKLYRLDEKDTQTKLDMLFKKNLYQMAINLAKSQHYDYEGLIDIFTQYGDHLNSKGDHDGAIQQYIRTIGHLEPSYVIRKFLDAQRIHNLTAYLQALHGQNLANKDHTTLLINCYTKLKDVQKLDEFVMTDRELNFDVETAIKVCRQAGYNDHALYLAKKFEEHDWCLKIYLELEEKDSARRKDNFILALKYMSGLPLQEADSYLKKYGNALVNEIPQETTALLKRLCTASPPAPAEGEEQGDEFCIRPEEFIHIYVNQTEYLLDFLEFIVKEQVASSSVIYNTLLELYLHRDPDDTQEVWGPKETKALQLLKNSEAKYHLDQAMVLTQMHDFTAGVLYLYEKAKLYQQILRYHMDHRNYAMVIETCKMHGNKDPNLWLQALSYFAHTDEECREQIVEVLAHIDKRNLLPPLMVVQTLANNSTATLATVRDYVVKRLQAENELVSSDERLIRQYREETEKTRAQCEELKTSAKIFQPSKCMLCRNPLDLPAVHFLCSHSYHQHCLEGMMDTDSECPQCQEKNRKVLDMVRAQEQNKELHEHFHNQLERAADGFTVVADYFGRGVFNKLTLVTDPSGE
ncbi:vacuolar protein sorting-associated protein 11 homolog [Sycon ciliatum]|uniref:vacuolar protein sorting-associated protein 11 homolog n=1 Tax=Sycon ciliatum TaxID=27933 RepID=UPI0031F696AE